jgi:hypothetical protein
VAEDYLLPLWWRRLRSIAACTRNDPVTRRTSMLSRANQVPNHLVAFIGHRKPVYCCPKSSCQSRLSESVRLHQTPVKSYSCIFVFEQLPFARDIRGDL